MSSILSEKYSSEKDERKNELLLTNLIESGKTSVCEVSSPHGIFVVKELEISETAFPSISEGITKGSISPLPR